MEFSISKTNLKRFFIVLFLIIALVIISIMINNRSSATTLTMGAVELNVRNLDSMKNFYQHMAGLSIVKETTQIIELGDQNEVLIRLFQENDLRLAPESEAGLYHTAIVYPTRKKLSEAINRVLTTMPEQYQGSSDHMVSEAFYFADPEGNGVEFYYDKPRSDWKFDAEGKPIMGGTYIDERNYIQEHINTEDNGGSIKMGHVHLKVGNIEEARKFYSEILLFDIINKREDSLFISRDGYHHHLGMNTWHSLGSTLRTENTYGLRSFEIRYSDRRIFEQVQSNLALHKNLIQEESENIFITQDPWGTKIRILMN